MHISVKKFCLVVATTWFFGFFTSHLFPRWENVQNVNDVFVRRETIEGFLAEQPILFPRPTTDDTNKKVNEGVASSEPHTKATVAASTEPLPSPPPFLLSNSSWIVYGNRSLSMDKFSIIIPTYKRIKLLLKVLDNYCSLDSHVDTIVVVWNDVQQPVSSELANFPCKVKLVVKEPPTNSLNNRFIFYPEIKTQAILSADDDLLINHDDLVHQFNTWKQFKHLIVGFAPRKHVKKSTISNQFVYGGPPKDGDKDRRYSFILTTSAMFHVQYLNLYQSQLPTNLRQFVDKNMNCEDIFINAIVADYLHQTMGSKLCPALLVPYKEIKMIEGENKGYKGLWNRPKHKKVREECLKLVADHFNGFPFDYSTQKITTA